MAHVVTDRKTMPQLPDPTTHTVGAIYAAYERAAERDERTYLGASVIGDECERRLWYGFRWATPPEDFDGRKLRLLETGHHEEARMIEDLGAAGVEVWDRNPETGEQWCVVAVDGHFRGHLDGVVLRVPEAPSTPHVLECKTHNEKSFKELVSKGVEASKPTHFAQMQVYMDLMGIPRALYLAVNKNTDEIYAERIAYDPVKAGQILAKAERIIRADRPPIGLDAKAWQCGYCPAGGVCRDRQFARRNCRTCLHATPIADGWRCELQDRNLTTDDQRAGCPSHRFIPALVPGEQIDVDGDRIIYALPGGQWIDGGEA
ncbi:PD-(D/E)XK nuclease family protein [Alsobacter sp. R-9]